MVNCNAMNITNLFKRISFLIRKYVCSPDEWAKYLGVNIGENNLIGKNHWSSEPYLITIGSNCQLTNCKIFTHGGEMLSGKNILILIYLDELLLVIGYMSVQTP